MKIYNYKCNWCGLTKEILTEVREIHMLRNIEICESCRERMIRTNYFRQNANI